MKCDLYSSAKSKSCYHNAEFIPFIWRAQIERAMLETKRKEIRRKAYFYFIVLFEGGDKWKA